MSGRGRSEGRCSRWPQPATHRRPTDRQLTGLTFPLPPSRSREGSTILTEGRNQSLPTRPNRGASTSPAIQAHVQTPWPAVHPSVHPTPGPKDPALSLGSLCTTSPTRHRASATGQSTLRAAEPPGVCTRHLPRRRSVPGSDRGRLRARGRNRPG